MVDGILVRFCEVMGAFYLDSFVLHEIQVRGNICKQRRLATHLRFSNNVFWVDVLRETRAQHHGRKK